MLVLPQNEPKFLKMLRIINTKFSERQLKLINQKLSIKGICSNQTSSIKLYNPFRGDKIPLLSDEQLERTILNMAKQMDEIHSEQLNDFCFELFIEKYYPRLILLLSQRHFHCAMFCYTVIRYLQERQKGSQLENHFYQKGPLRLLNLFSEVLEKRKKAQMSASVTSKENADEIHNIFCVVLLLASIKYIQSNEELIKQYKYTEWCLKISVELIHQAEKPPEFAILRELLSVASNLLIFNGMSVRPSYFAQFCLDHNLQLHDHEQYKEIIDEQVIQRYFQGLKVYIKLDPKYQKGLTLYIKKLIYLNISNPLLYRHVDILISLIQQKIFPSLNAQFHSMLIEAENSTNSQLIDDIYDRLLRNGIQILPEEIQKLNIILAEKGSNQRKKNCANAYYSLYSECNGKILEKTVNFILQTYLTQNLVLQNIESMMIGCANAIFSNNLEKLHHLIGENKYIELLSSVLEKRTNCFNSHQPNLRFSFVQEDWLLAAGRNLEIYRTYLKIVVNMLCGNIDISSDRLSTQPICIQQTHRSRCEQFYSIILRSAQKAEIFDDEIFKHAVLCQAILGDQLPLQTYCYYSKYISLVSNEKSNFLQYLQLLLITFKTSSSVILYLHALLDAQDNMADFFHLKKLYYLNLLAKMVQDSQYFRINAFSYQGVVLLYELSLKVKGQSFQKDIVAIMTTWCSHLTRVDARNLCYLFIYREIKKAYPFIKQHEMEEPIERLKELWKLILLFLDQGKTTRNYLKMSQNKIILQSKSQQEHRRIKIQGSFLINIQLQYIWTICIETSIKRYKISIIKNQAIITTNDKSGKEMEKVIRFLVKEKERSSIFQQNDKSVLDFALHLEGIEKDKIVANLRISQFQPLQLRLIGSVLEISIETHDQIILKSIKIMDFATPGIFHSIFQHIHSINQWLIKTKKLKIIRTSSFSDKFDFDHAYCYFIEMLKHFNHISLSLVFDIFVKLSLIIVKYIQNEVSNNNKKPAIFIQTFNLLEQTYPDFRSKYRELSPTIEIVNSFEYSRPLYYLLVSGLLPVCFWRHFRKETRRSIERLLVEIMDAAEFRTLENNRLEFFDRCLELAQYQLAQHTSRMPYLSGQQLKFVSFFLQKCNEIITSHPLNHILGFKLKKMIFLAKKKEQFQENLKLLIKQIIKFLTIQNIKYNRQRQASRFIVINFEYIHHLFLFCEIEDQLNIIHYLSQSPTEKIRNSKPHIAVIQLATLIATEQKNRLISWIIVQLKKYLFMFMKKDIVIKQNDAVLSFINFYLELLFTYRQFCSEYQIDNMFKVIEESLNILINELTIEKGKMKHQNFFDVKPYVGFFVYIETEIINKYEDMNERKLKRKKDILLRLENSILKLISIKFTKKTFLAFMISLRSKCITNKKLILAIINHQQFSKLKLYHFSIFLQFIVEILMIIDVKSPFSAKQNKEIAQYVYYFIHNIIPTEGSRENLAEVPRYLFYTFPYLTCSSDCYSQILEQSLQRFKNVQTKKVKELNGGIYFKCLLIIIKLMKISPQEDCSDLIQYFLIGKDGGANQKPSNRMQEKSQEIRHAIDRHMAECAKEHKLYYNEFDMALMLQADSIAIHSYIVDYFLMNFAQYLQTRSSKIDEKLLKKYSVMFVQCCSQENIWNDILSSQPNPQKINSYEIAVNQLKKDPNYRTSRDEEKLAELPDLTLSRGKSAKFNYEAKDVISSLLLQRRRTEKALYDDQEKKAQVFELIKKNHKNWFRQPDCNNISLFFDDKAKEIRLIQLIHTHFVLKSKERPSKKKDNDFKKEFQGFQIIYKDKLNQERTQASKTISYLEQKARKVKRIFPYTCRRIPVLRIMQNCLANMSSPLTSKFVVDEYDAAYCQSQMSINMNYFISTANHIVGDFQSHRQITEEIFQHHEDVPFQIKVIKNGEIQEDRESSVEGSIQMLKQGNFCELITREGAYFCEYQIKEKSLKLVTKDKRPESQFWYLKVGTPEDNIIKIENQEITIFFQDVYEILYRKYNQITNNSLEIFYKNGTSKFITFYIKKMLNPFVKKLQQAIRGLHIINDPVRHFQQQRYTEKWVTGYLSNFDYLMLLNKYSSRTYNDLNQYYVFPWVLQNYTTPSLDLTNPKNYRDLGKPIGALNSQQLGQFMEKYYMENLSERCLYRSHYSTQAFVFYYLFRLEPYSSLYRKLQGDQWDDADRLFSSVSQVWASLTDKKQDLKQCLPEFYYFPTFLKNVSNIQFGKRQCGTKVNDVQLPLWCSSPQEFIITMRAALESDYVSENLHLWIDLIFGKHQNSIEKLNVFRPLSYADPQIYSKIKNLSNAQIKGHVTEISYFGQCPLQIFKKEHRPKMRKKPNEEILTPSNSFINSEYLSISGWKIISLESDEQNFFLELSDKKQKQWISMPILASESQMKLSIFNLDPIQRIEARKQSGVDVKINAKCELAIGNEYIMDILVRFDYSHIVSNEMWVACFGSKGIKIYNWEMVQQWSWLKDQVRQLYLEVTRLIFSTPCGKLYFYSFLDRKIQEFVVFEDTCDMKIRVAPLPRLSCSQKNLIQYRILCIGDETKVSMVHHNFQQTCNYTSNTLKMH